MKNRLIAKIFYNIADLLDLQGVSFKPRAYRRAALSIESLSEDIESIKDLKSILGVGRHLEKKIIEIIKTGRLTYYERLKKQTPIDIESLNNIPGLGPKRIQLLYKKYKVRNIQDLKKVIRQHKIKELIGEKTEKNLEESIDFARKKTKGFLLGFIWEDALKIKHNLEKQNFILKAEITGSFRRRKEIVNDLDILVASNQPSKVMDFFTKDSKKILAKGMTKSSIILENDLQIDLRVIKEESFGAALQYFTGSKLHNIHLRKIAIKKGCRLSEYGLFKNNKLIASKTEKEIYNKLSLPYIEPELREDRGEFEKQPSLIRLEDIKGDLHIHTNYSDGEDSIKEMVEKARFLKYKYIGITDHFGSLKIANSMDIKRFNNQKKEINKLNFNIFHGIEANIKANGSIDAPNNLDVDYMIGSIHAGFSNDKEKQTKRILLAMDNEKVKILGHLTGRLLNKRRGYDLDFDKIFDKAYSNNVVVEVNSFPDRVDLDDSLIKKAIEHKVRLAINTDAHSQDNMNFMRFGIFQARRGWCEKKNVINTLNKLKF